jgi:hypothetical protein
LYPDTSASPAKGNIRQIGGKFAVVSKPLIFGQATGLAPNGPAMIWPVISTSSARVGILADRAGFRAENPDAAPSLTCVVALRLYEGLTMPRTLDIALLQTRPKPDFVSALEEAMPLAEAAVQAGAAFVFLPEYCGGLASEGAFVAPPTAPEADHPVLAAFRAFATRHRVWVMLGSIAIDGPDGKLLNRGYVIDDMGAFPALAMTVLMP